MKLTTSSGSAIRCAVYTTAWSGPATLLLSGGDTPPVQRLHTGPLGLEVVLADSTGDPFYPAYRNADSLMGTALCDRGPQPYVLAGGSFGTVGPAPGPWVPGGGGCAAAPRPARGVAVAMLLGALACWTLRRRR